MSSRASGDADSIKALRRQLLTAVQTGAPDQALHKFAFDELVNAHEIDSQTTLEWLSLLATTARYVSTFGNDATLVDDVYQQLVPAFRPEGSVISKILTQLGSSSKAHTARSSEALSAIGHLSAALPPPSTGSSQEQNFLVPFSSWLGRNGLRNKADLAAALCVIDRMPEASLSPELLHHLLEDLSLSTYTNFRSVLIAKLLCRRTGSTATVFEILLPSLEEGRVSETTTLNVNRHLLPTLFREDRTTCKKLLGLLENPAGTVIERYFPAWIAVASAGMSEGILNLEDLPSEAVSSGAVHYDPDVRLRTFRLIATSKNILSATAVNLVRLVFSSNGILSSLDSRSSFVSTSRTLFVNLQLQETAIKAASQKLATGMRSKKLVLSPSALEAAIHSAVELHAWIMNDFVTPALADSRHPPVAKALLALGVLQQYLIVFGPLAGTQQLVFSSERVSFLIGCQASDYTEVRTRARHILESASLLLPGYDQLESQDAIPLLADSLDSLSHPRRTQAEAGKSTLCIIFRKLVYENDDQVQSRSRAFVHDLLDRLEASVAQSEADLVEGMRHHPFHGQLLALHDLFGVVELNAKTQAVWGAVFKRMNTLVHRIWIVTKRVISLQPSDEGAEHEIARAYALLGGDEDADADEEGLDHTGILSGCFRATSNASELLSAIFARALQSQVNECFWSRLEVDVAGQTFLTWLHEVRHRGTFTRIADAFTLLVDCVRQREDLASLREHWLESELHVITLDKFSITRRSAALPYSFLALTNGDAELLNIAVARLLGLADVHHPSSSITKVHCFNILKIILLDAKHSKYVDKYFEQAVISALKAFGSPDWNVRNAGQILFSTLVHRSLGNAKTAQDMLSSRAVLATRHTFASWTANYPSLLPYLANYLQHLAASDPSGSARHSALFPVLIILRSLRWTKEGEEVQEELAKATLPFLGSHEWQVREVAAQAMSALTDPEHATKLAMSLCSEIRTDSSDIDSIHGRACFLNLLAQNVIEWSQMKPPETEALADDLCASLSEWTKVDVPLVGTELVKAMDATLSASPEFESRKARAQAIAQVRLLLDGSTSLGFDLLRDACAAMLFRHEGKAMIDFLSEPTLALALQSLPAQSNVSDPRVLKRVIMIVCAAELDLELRVDALQALCESHWDANTLGSISNPTLDSLSQEMGRSLASSTCVQVREASLPALSWALSQMVTHDIANTELLQELVTAIHAASNENQSEPCRSSSMRALRPLAQHLFSASPSSGPSLPSADLQLLHQSLLRLLQDDDEDIRDGAANIVSEGLGQPRRVHEQVIDLWWAWMQKHVSKASSANTASWLDWMTALWLDTAGFDVDLKRLSAPTHAEVLFEVEPPNLYRNPLDDASHAASILASIPANTIPVNALACAEELWNKGLAALSQARQASPIADVWEAARVVKRRIDILDVVLQRRS